MPERSLRGSVLHPRRKPRIPRGGFLERLPVRPAVGCAEDRVTRATSSHCGRKHQARVRPVRRDRSITEAARPFRRDVAELARTRVQHPNRAVRHPLRTGHVGVAQIQKSIRAEHAVVGEHACGAAPDRLPASTRVGRPQQIDHWVMDAHKDGRRRLPRLAARFVEQHKRQPDIAERLRRKVPDARPSRTAIL